MTFKVVHVNTARAYRGGERQTELLIRELSKRGIEQRLVARRGAPLTERFGDLDIEIREAGGHFLAVTAATKGADIVQVHEGRSVYGAWGRHLVSGTPYVLTRRVDNPISRHCFSTRAYRSAAYVVAVAEDVAEIVRRFDPDIRVQVIRSASSGLPVDAAQSREIRASYPGSFIVGHVGALDNPQKAQEHIIAVARKLADERPDMHFVMVGGGDDEAMLKDLARGLRNVTFTGFVDNVGDYLASFDLFILPSRREGIGGILLDAMDQQLPIIASRVGGVPSIVGDRENGLLIDSDRPDQLEAAILELADDEALRKRMGERGRTVSQQHTAGIMAEKYLALYRDILGGGNGR